MSVPQHAGVTGADDPRLLAIVAGVLGQPVEAVEGLAFDRVPHEIGSPMTHSLWRVSGTASTGDDPARPWVAFLKVLQSPWAWEGIEQVPEQYRASFADGVPWRLEVQALSGPVPAALPPGLRMPRLLDVVETDHQHCALWTEWVDADSRRWTRPDYRLAAHLLGRLAGRRPEGTELLFRPDDAVMPAGAALRYFAFGRVLHAAVPALADEGVWHHPVLAAAVEAEGLDAATLRADLVAAAAQVPWWLDVLDGLPQAYGHGDASPENLLLPRDEPGTIVAIDVGFTTRQALGFDLGQLLVGRVHSMEDAVLDVLAHLADVVAAYQDGVAEESHLDTAQVRLGCIGSVVVRSLFTAIPVELLGRPDVETLLPLFRARVAMARALLDLARDELPWHDDPGSVRLDPPPLSLPATEPEPV